MKNSKRPWPWRVDSPRSDAPRALKPASRSANPWPARWSSCPPNAPRPPAGVVEEELNVDHLEYGQELAEVLSFELVPNFRSVGPRLGEAVKELRGALSALDAGEAAARSRRARVSPSPCRAVPSN